MDRKQISNENWREMRAALECIALCDDIGKARAIALDALKRDEESTQEN